MIEILEIWNNVWPYLVAILLFLVLIVIHEFGHFIAAKSLGVRVNEFAIGFGPKLFSKKWGETKYALNLIPLGGYCAMEGEDEGSTDTRAFCNKKAWRRFLIVIMGAVFNLLLGVIIVAIILAPIDVFATTKIAKFDENSISASSGLMIGDEILKVDGRTIFSTYDLSYAFTNVKEGKIDIVVERDGERKELKDVKFATQTYEGIDFLTVDFKVEPQEKTFGSYIKYIAKTSASYCAVIWRRFTERQVRYKPGFGSCGCDCCNCRCGKAKPYEFVTAYGIYQYKFGYI